MKLQATSDGGLNLDPYAWENTEQTKFMKGPESRYPAQVSLLCAQNYTIHGSYHDSIDETYVASLTLIGKGPLEIPEATVE